MSISISPTPTRAISACPSTVTHRRLSGGVFTGHPSANHSQRISADAVESSDKFRELPISFLGVAMSCWELPEASKKLQSKAQLSQNFLDVNNHNHIGSTYRDTGFPVNGTGHGSRRDRRLELFAF